MPNLKNSLLLSFTLLAASPLAADIRGLYGSDCLAMEGLSAKKDFLFKDQSMETVQTVYADLECGVPVYDFSFLGDYIHDADRQTLDHSYSSITLRALDERVTAAFNEVSLCGISDWVLNEAREVAGLECGGQHIPQAGTKVYDIVREAKDDKSRFEGLQLGLSSEAEDGLSAETRPTQLDPIVYQAK